MIKDLEETLRDELSARVDGLPQAPDLADVVIGRARRVRRRQKITAAACSCLLVLAGITSWSAIKFDWWQIDDAAVLADAAAELGEFSVLSTNGDILTGAGDLYSTELAVADTAVEVHGGWVVTGSSTEDSSDQVARYVGFDGENTDLGSGDQVLVHTSERGDAVAVELIGSDEPTTAQAFVVTSESNVYARGGIEVPAQARIGGMTNTAVWIESAASGAEDSDLNVPDSTTWLWSFTGTSAALQQTEYGLPAGATLIKSIASNRVLITVPGTNPDDMCLAAATVSDDIYLDYSAACFSELSLMDVVVGPDGHQAMGYVQPTEPTETDPGEWVWLPLDGTSALQPTGFVDFETKPFFTYHDVAFFDPDGTWYDINGMKLGIPPLDGQPIPIKHIPGQN